MPRSVPRELSELLRRHEREVQATALAMRDVVLDETGPCHETIQQFYGGTVISLIYSTTEKRMKDNICLVVVYRDHVNLLFPRGVDLTDAKGLLEGSGKAMRHVKMHSPADTTRPGVGALIRQAKQRPEIAKPAKGLTRIVTSVKAKPAPKRRTLPRMF